MLSKKHLFLTATAILTALFYHNKHQPLSVDGIKGRKILITGASSGIGEALAYEYAKHGASVFITARREHRLQKVVQKCSEIAPPGTVFGYYAADMKNYKEESKHLIQAAIDQMAGIDTIIVNHLLLDTMFNVWEGSEENLEMFDMMTEVNLMSYVHIVSHGLKHFRTKSSAYGRIGVVGSIKGKMPVPLAATYSCSKFGLDGFFSSLRLELEQAHANITISYAAIGITDTDLLKNIIPKDFQNLNYQLFHDRIQRSNQALTNVNDVAYNIMLATENGMAELYYPYYYTSRLLTMPSSWISIIRRLAPIVTELHWFPKEMYDMVFDQTKPESSQ